MKIRDYKILRTCIRQRMNRNTTKDLLEALGVHVGRDYRLIDNCSFSIDKNGYIKDFGSTNFRGDIVAFIIDVLGSSPREAIEWTAKSLGVWDE